MEPYWTPDVVGMMPSNSSIGLLHYAIIFTIGNSHAKFRWLRMVNDTCVVCVCVSFVNIFVALFYWRHPRMRLAALVLTAAANALSVYLAYVLVARLRNLCLLCVTIYGVNAASLYAVITR